MSALMNRRRAIAALSVVAGTGLHRTSLASSRNYGITGQQAPDVSAAAWIDHRGDATAFEMSELRGKWLYLKCFQSWCPGCHKYGFPALKRVSDALAGNDQFVALAVQTVFEGFLFNTQSKLREIQRQYNLSLKFGHDDGSQADVERSVTMQRYRTGATPWVVIVSPAGQVLFNNYHVDVDKTLAFFEREIG